MAQRILFATMPFDGHFSPLTGMARHLNDQGRDVRWYAGPSYARKLADLGIPHVPFQRAREVSGEKKTSYPAASRTFVLGPTATTLKTC